MEETNDIRTSKKSDQIREFGRAMKVTREFAGLSIYDLEKFGLNHVIADRMENGTNYSLKSVFKYLSVLKVSGAFFMYAYDEEAKWIKDVSTPEAFGSAMKDYRNMKKVTLNAMLIHTGLRNSQVLNIEKGKSCNSSTLQRYMSVFPDLHLDLAIR